MDSPCFCWTQNLCINYSLCLYLFYLILYSSWQISIHHFSLHLWQLPGRCLLHLSKYLAKWHYVEWSRHRLNFSGHSLQVVWLSINYLNSLCLSLFNYKMKYVKIIVKIKQWFLSSSCFGSNSSSTVFFSLILEKWLSICVLAFFLTHKIDRLIGYP